MDILVKTSHPEPAETIMEIRRKGNIPLALDNQRAKHLQIFERRY